MSKLDNVIRINGNVGGDPEFSKAGKTDKARFSVATNESRKDSDGKYSDYTEWHNVEVFGGLVKVVKKHVRKGSSIQIRGKMEYGSYIKVVKVGRESVDVKIPTAVVRADTIDISFRKTSSNEEE